MFNNVHFRDSVRFVVYMSLFGSMVAIGLIKAYMEQDPFNGMILSLVGLVGFMNFNYTRIRYNVMMWGSETKPQGK